MYLVLRAGKRPKETGRAQ